MKQAIAIRLLTSSIAALYVALQLLVAFPIAHVHHNDHAHHCNCAHSFGHFHAAESDCKDACIACQILALSVLPAAPPDDIQVAERHACRPTESFSPGESRTEPTARAPPQGKQNTL